MYAFFSSLHLDLDVFQGPLELFVQLVQREEMEIFSVSLTDLSATLLASPLELEEGGYFLEGMTTLLQKKSCFFVPKPEEEEEVLVAPEETLHHLLSYCQFKESLAEFDTLASLAYTRFPRGSEPYLDKQGPLLPKMTLEELSLAFSEVLKRKKPVHLVENEEEWEAQRARLWLVQMLEEKTVCAFTSLMLELPSREACIAVFLVLLEMMKEEKLQVSPEQEVRLC